MLKFCSKHDGAISVFLTLILLPTFIFGGVIVDGTRILGSKNIISGAGDLAMNGALANYDADLNEAYGLIAMADTPEELESNLQDYFEATLNANGLTTEDFNKALIQLELIEGAFSAESIDETQIYQTEVMKQEILEYMKYRAPVTFVNRSILGKMEQFKNIEKEKKAVDSQIKFESELEELQGKFDDLLKEVNTQKNVYTTIRPTAEISAQMQKTKDNYSQMSLLGIAYYRLTTDSNITEGDQKGLLFNYNDIADGCNVNIEKAEGFESLLKMIQIEKGIGDPYGLLEGLDEESDEYKELQKELNEYGKNREFSADQIIKTENFYEKLSEETYNNISATYSCAKMGYDSANEALEKLGELKAELDKCSRLYRNWNTNVEDLPASSSYKADMEKQVNNEVYQTLFGEKGEDEFSVLLQNNKTYYEKVKTQLETLQFNAKKAVEVEGYSAISAVVSGAAGNVRTQAELNQTAREMFQANWSGSYQLNTDGYEKQSLENTEFVKFLRENSVEKNENADSAKEKENVDKWNDDLAETLESYAKLFLSYDITEQNALEIGQNDIPSVWLAAASTQQNGEEAAISGNMSDKKSRKNVSDSASDAMNINNSALSLLGGLEDLLMNGAENLYISEYVMGMFSYYTVNRDAEGNEQDSPLTINNQKLKDNVMYRAEVEYIIWGDADSRDNVTKMKAMIFAIQFVCNAISAFTDDTLVRDAKIIAAFFPFGKLAQEAIKIALLSVVTIIETTNDLKDIVEGKTVPLMKGKAGGWETWLIDEGKKGTGSLPMKYDDYLWLFVFINACTNQKNLLARTADCIELNQTEKKSDNEKSLKERYTMVQISADVTTETFFMHRIQPQSTPAGGKFVIHYNGLQGY